MKVNYDVYGSLELIAEDGRDHLWLAEFLRNIPKEIRSKLDNFIEIDLDSSCIKDDLGTPARECSISEIFSQDDNTQGDNPWGTVERISLHPLGF